MLYAPSIVLWAFAIIDTMLTYGHLSCCFPQNPFSVVDATCVENLLRTAHREGPGLSAALELRKRVRAAAAVSLPSTAPDGAQLRADIARLIAGPEQSLRE